MSLPEDPSRIDGSWYEPVPYGSPVARMPEPRPVPRRSVAKTVAGGLLALASALFVFGAVTLMIHGTFHFNQFVAAALCIGLPAWGAQRLLTAHSRELAAWEEERRRNQLAGGYGSQF